MNDPYLILGVSREADDAAIQRAYLEGIKRAPPEHDPERFEALRGAYEALRTRRDRMAHALFNTSPPTGEDLLERAAPIGAATRPNLALMQGLLRGDP